MNGRSNNIFSSTHANPSEILELAAHKALVILEIIEPFCRKFIATALLKIHLLITHEEIVSLLITAKEKQPKEFDRMIDGYVQTVSNNNKKTGDLLGSILREFNRMLSGNLAENSQLMQWIKNTLYSKETKWPQAELKAINAFVATEIGKRVEALMLTFKKEDHAKNIRISAKSSPSNSASSSLSSSSSSSASSSSSSSSFSSASSSLASFPSAVTTATKIEGAVNSKTITKSKPEEQTALSQTTYDEESCNDSDDFESTDYSEDVGAPSISPFSILSSSTAASDTTEVDKKDKAEHSTVEKSQHLHASRQHPGT